MAAETLTPDYKKHRSPLFITLSTWKALFLREAISRLSAGRAAWLWLLLEPIIHVAVLLTVFTVIRMRVVGGIDTSVWLMVGMVFFFMFKRPANQAKGAINANQALFTYRQVKPVDTVLARAALEGFLMIIITIIMAAGATFLGIDLVPNDPLALLVAFFGLWLMGLGFGLITSVSINLVPELGKIIDLMMTPLYMLSGVILPISGVPDPYRQWLLFNPIAHGIEAARLGISPYYHAIPELSVVYLYQVAIAFIFLGLALHNHFATKILRQ